MATIETAALSDPGHLRGQRPNEDTCYASAQEAHDGGTLLVVADGLGGMPGGREASTRAVEALCTASFAGDPRAALSNAFVAARAAVRAVRSSGVLFSGAGTTLVAAYLRDDRGWIANVGDSRAYLVRDGHVTAVTRDHSYVQALVDSGELAAEASHTHPARNVVTRVVGDAESIPDLFELDLRASDLFILCSDGLWGPVSEGRLASLVGDAVARPAAALAQALIDAANASGGPDNVSVALARVGSG